MPERDAAPEMSAEGDERSMSGRYVAALVIEVVVLIGLWAFGAYFGA